VGGGAKFGRILEYHAPGPLSTDLAPAPPPLKLTQTECHPTAGRRLPTRIDGKRESGGGAKLWRIRKN
jgi:hypothetical protein